MQPDNQKNNQSAGHKSSEGPLAQYSNPSAPASSSADSDSPFYKSAAPTISLPKGGGAIKGIDEKFSVNAINGTANLSIPLPLSPGRNNFTPALSLSYNSGGGNSAFGLGWNLSLPSITRKTDKKLPEYLDSDESDIFLLAGAEDLIPQLDSNENPVVVNSVDYTIKRYRPRIEGLFARIEHIRENGTDNSWWRVTTKENMTTYYGLDGEARITDPAIAKHIYEWLPQLCIDDKGNVQRFRYAAEDKRSVAYSAHERNRLDDNALFTNRYLKRIQYCNQFPYHIDAATCYKPAFPGNVNFLMEAVLDYGDHSSPQQLSPDQEWPCRNDAFSSYRAGFEIRTYRRCQRVMMFHHFEELNGNDLVRSLELTYQQNGGQLAEADLIVSATQTGHRYIDGAWKSKSLPAMAFEYQSLNWNTELKKVDAGDFAGAPQGLTGPYQWFDLEGEGISGILSEQDGGWFYKSNLGDGHFTEPRLVASKPSFNGLNNGAMHWQDIDGDGRRQVVSDGAAKGYWELDDDLQWQSFQSFDKNINIDWNNPFTKMLDLDGDGKADVLITEDGVWTWWQNNGKEGFDKGGQVTAALDENKGPVLLLCDAVQRIFLADMSGDGLTDLVRIKNGEVCYWPNKGYGKFGAKVTMSNAPVFQTSDLYNPQYLSLADISGTGAADIIYIRKGKCSAWINFAGNGFSEEKLIGTLPATDAYGKIAVLDFLGNGTGCIVWSSPLPQHAVAPLRYIDLMGGVKPYIMTGYHNNMGKSVQLQFKCATKYYLEDKAAGTPWATRLPFPVQCLSSVITTDAVSETSYTQRYSYHHGYYDHEEREFRGFGRVDVVDTDTAVFYTPTDQLTNQPIDSLDQIPVLTKTWYHTGAWLREKTLLDQYGKEYFTLNGDVVLPNNIEQPSNLTPQEWREAHRALKGSPLRQEVYATDCDIPYTITTTAYDTRLIQPVAQNCYASFLTTQLQSLVWSCERDTTHPRVQHSITLTTDEYGNVLESATIAYGKDNNSATPSEQKQVKVVHAQTKYTGDIIDSLLHYRLRVGYETAAWEAILPGIADCTKIWSVAECKNYIATATEQLLSCSRSVFLKDDLSAPEQLGVLTALAIPHQQYTLAFTKESLDNCYTIQDSNGQPMHIISEDMLSEGKYLRSTDVSAFSSVSAAEDEYWWIPSGRASYSATPADDFYQPSAFNDPWGNQTQIGYWGDYHLLPQSVIAPVTQPGQPASETIVLAYDWHSLQPQSMQDENDNISEICYDALGMAVATAVKGKGDEADYLGQINGAPLIADSSADQATQQTFWNAIDNNAAASIDASAKALLGKATWRCVYDLQSQPVRVAMIARKEHYVLNANSDVISRVSYTDGFGRVAMHKAQCEPNGNVILSGVEGWIGSGKTVYNNKGKVVLQYEPYFSATAAYDHALQASLPSSSGVGGAVSARIYYDPLGRVYKTEMPDGSYTYTKWDSWSQTVYDANDALGNWVNGQLIELPGMPQTWYNDHHNSTISEERDAAAKAAVHANTPTVMQLDVLARPFTTRQYLTAPVPDGTGEAIDSFADLDIIGNQLSVTDGLGRKQLIYQYNLVKSPCYQKSIDGGEQRNLVDVAGKPLYHWDATDLEKPAFHFTYDALHRPLTHEHWNGTTWSVLEKTVYGEGQPDNKANNLRGKVYEHYDGSGKQYTETYDFKGVPLIACMQLLADATLADVSWNINPPLIDAKVFTTSMTYNALGQVLSQTDAGENITYNTYDAGGLLKTVSLKPKDTSVVTTYVQNICYDAKGQRQFIKYGNGTKTTYTYDPLSYRLTRLVTRKGSDTDALQDLNYYYDAVGNITRIRDDAQATIFFNNSIIEPIKDFTYDALYRLITAKGREQVNAMANGASDNVYDMCNVVSATNPNAVQNYVQYYTYDAVGNILQLKHQAVSGSFTRNYIYVVGSNKLLQTQVGKGVDNNTYNYTHDVRGNITTMPHLTAAWDSLNQMASSSSGGYTTSYQYAGGQQIRKTITKATITETRIYLGSYERYQKTENGIVTLERTTVHIADDSGRIAMLETRTIGTDDAPPVLQRYIYSNHLQSATLELNETADVISYEEYHPYGTTAYQANSATIKAVAKRYRFTGKERDEESGLYYHGARYYAPWLGRWIAVDPLESKYASQSCYVYCSSNPINRIDPSGKGDQNPIPAPKMSDGTTAKYTFIKRVFDCNLNPIKNDVIVQWPDEIEGMPHGQYETITVEPCPSVPIGPHDPEASRASNPKTKPIVGFSFIPYGNKVTPMEAAYMADNVYATDRSQTSEATIGDWKEQNLNIPGVRLIDKKSGFKSAIYGRMSDDGKMEYSYVTAGTDMGDVRFAGDWANNFLQALGKDAKQYDLSVKNARLISDYFANTGSSLTFVGHSLGGGMASANAMATGHNAITFNAAGLSPVTIDRLKLYEHADIQAYVVQGEIVSYSQSAMGLKAEGELHILYSIYEYKNSTLAYLVQRAMNHTMGVVKQKMKEQGVK